MVDIEPFTGVVEFLDDRKAVGLITASDGRKVTFVPQAIQGRALRTACTGELVKGTLYLQVHPKEWRASEIRVISEDGSPEEKDPTSVREEARLTAIGAQRGYYELQSNRHQNIILQSSKILRPLSKPLQFGDKISCIVVPTKIGYQAILPPEDEGIIAQMQQFGKPADYYLSQAILNRDNKQYDKARNFFQEGIRVAPSHALYSSYAAMERNLNDFERAITVLREAVKRYPNVGKFYEDLGNLLYKQRQYKEAIEVLDNGLRTALGHHILHRFLARSLMAEGTEVNLKRALLEYEQTNKLGLLYPEDNLPYKELKVQLGHQRGQLALRFLREARLHLEELEFHRQATYAVDLLVTATVAEYVETYDLRDSLCMRCYFQNLIKPEDIKEFLDNRCDLLTRPRVNPEVLFVIVHSTEGIREYLYRLNDQLLYPTVVPLDETILVRGVQGFREALDDWLFRRDLYDFRYPVSGRRFFGRETEIKRIEDAIEDNEWVGVFGLRKIGKTSLIDEIARRRQRDIIASCDMLKHASIPSCDFLFVEIARLFNEELSKKFDSTYKSMKRKLRLLPNTETILEKREMADIALKFDHDMEIVLSAFRSAHLRMPKFLVILDEVERLLPIHNQPGIAGYDAFLSYLRGESQRLKCLSLLLVGANPMVSEMPKWGQVDNPLFEFVKVIYLPPLRPEECAEMAVKLGRGMGIEYEDEALQSLYDLTGGHPYIARQYCSFISRRIRERPLRISRNIIEQNADDFIFERSHVFQEILDRLDRDYPEEKDLLLFIADGISSEKELESLSRHSCQNALQHLAGYQLIRRQDNGNYLVRIGLLGRWLEKNWLGK